MNPDGSVDLYYGPTPPKGKEKNWVQTIPGQGWWVYLRFYAPTKAYFDKSWSIGDFEKIHRPADEDHGFTDTVRTTGG